MNPPKEIELRDWFAGMALAGFAGQKKASPGKDMAFKAYRQADFMLAVKENRYGALPLGLDLNTVSDESTEP